MSDSHLHMLGISVPVGSNPRDRLEKVSQTLSVLRATETTLRIALESEYAAPEATAAALGADIATTQAQLSGLEAEISALKARIKAHKNEIGAAKDWLGTRPDETRLADMDRVDIEISRRGTEINSVTASLVVLVQRQVEARTALAVMIAHREAQALVPRDRPLDLDPRLVALRDAITKAETAFAALGGHPQAAG